MALSCSSRIYIYIHASMAPEHEKFLFPGYDWYIHRENPSIILNGLCGGLLFNYCHFSLTYWSFLDYDGESFKNICAVNTNAIQEKENSKLNFNLTSQIIIH